MAQDRSSLADSKSSQTNLLLNGTPSFSLSCKTLGRFLNELQSSSELMDKELYESYISFRNKVEKLEFLSSEQENLIKDFQDILYWLTQIQEDKPNVFNEFTYYYYLRYLICSKIFDLLKHNDFLREKYSELFKQCMDCINEDIARTEVSTGLPISKILNHAKLGEYKEIAEKMKKIKYDPDQKTPLQNNASFSALFFGFYNEFMAIRNHAGIEYLRKKGKLKKGKLDISTFDPNKIDDNEALRACAEAETKTEADEVIQKIINLFNNTQSKSVKQNWAKGDSSIKKIAFIMASLLERCKREGDLLHLNKNKRGKALQHSNNLRKIYSLFYALCVHNEVENIKKMIEIHTRFRNAFIAFFDTFKLDYSHLFNYIDAMNSRIIDSRRNFPLSPLNINIISEKELAEWEKEQKNNAAAEQKIKDKVKEEKSKKESARWEEKQKEKATQNSTTSNANTASETKQEKNVFEKGDNLFKKNEFMNAYYEYISNEKEAIESLNILDMMRARLQQIECLDQQALTEYKNESDKFCGRGVATVEVLKRLKNYYKSAQIIAGDMLSLWCSVSLMSLNNNESVDEKDVEKMIPKSRLKKTKESFTIIVIRVINNSGDKQFFCYADKRGNSGWCCTKIPTDANTILDTLPFNQKGTLKQSQLDLRVIDTLKISHAPFQQKNCKEFIQKSMESAIHDCFNSQLAMTKTVLANLTKKSEQMITIKEWLLKQSLRLNKLWDERNAAMLAMGIEKWQKNSSPKNLEANNRYKLAGEIEHVKHLLINHTNSNNVDTGPSLRQFSLNSVTISIPLSHATLIRTLLENKAEAFIVGGWVRKAAKAKIFNAPFCPTTDDLDIVKSNTCDVMKVFADKNPIRTLNPQLQWFNLYHNQNSAPLRVENWTSSNLNNTPEGRKLEAQNRQITTNGLFATAPLDRSKDKKDSVEVEVLDFGGLGLKDLTEGRIRMHTDPLTAFYTDPTLLLQCIYRLVTDGLDNFGPKPFLDESIKKAIREFKLNTQNLEESMAGRINTLFGRKLLSGQHAHLFFEKMVEEGITDIFFPDIASELKKHKEEISSQLIKTRPQVHEQAYACFFEYANKNSMRNNRLFDCLRNTMPKQSSSASSQDTSSMPTTGLLSSQSFLQSSTSQASSTSDSNPSRQPPSPTNKGQSD